MKIESKIDKVMSQLPPLIDDYMIDHDLHSFSSGDGYIQHVPAIVDKAMRDFLDICYEFTGNKIYLEKNIHRQGIIGRYLDDSNISVLYKNWHRFVCIDDNYREWGQPYFSMNPEAQKIANTKMCLNLKLPQLREYFINHMRDEKLNEILK